MNVRVLPKHFLLFIRGGSASIWLPAKVTFSVRHVPSMTSRLARSPKCGYHSLPRSMYKNCHFCTEVSRLRLGHHGARSVLCKEMCLFGQRRDVSFRTESLDSQVLKCEDTYVRGWSAAGLGRWLIYRACVCLSVYRACVCLSIVLVSVYRYIGVLDRPLYINARKSMYFACM